MQRMLVLTLVSLVTIPSAAFAQVRLEWKRPAGVTWESTAVQKVEQTLTIGGADLPSGQSQTIRTSTSYGPVRPDGTQVARTQFKSLKSELTLPGGIQLTYDSAKPKEPQGTQVDFLLDIFEAMSKLKMTTTYDAEGQPVNVEVDEKTFADLDENGKQLIKDQLDPDYLVEAVRKEQEQVPSRALQVGDTWNVTQDVRLGGGQTLTVTTQYRYEGPTEKNGRQLHRIVSKAEKVAYDQKDGTPLKVVGSDLKVDSSEGHLLFDARMGTVVEKHDKTRITGAMQFEIAGARSDGKLDLRLDNTETVRAAGAEQR